MGLGIITSDLALSVQISEDLMIVHTSPDPRRTPILFHFNVLEIGQFYEKTVVNFS